MSQVEHQAVSPERVKRRRHLIWNLAGLAVALIALVAALVFWAGTEDFARIVRQQIVTRLQTATGGRVEIQDFRWSVLDLAAEARGVIIHGTEESDQAPYLQLDRMTARISVLGILSPRILLRDLEVIRPQFHLIFYPNGSTNQPHPRTTSQLKRPVLETLFSLKAGHIAIEQGLIDIDNRAASFDFRGRYLPLDFAANDASMVLKYVPPQGASPEVYHVEAGVRDLALARGGTMPTAPPPVHGFVQASIDLTHNAAYLRSLRIVTSTRGARDRTLEVSGRLFDYAHARWDAKLSGELDLRLLNPVLGYPSAPEGIARMQLRGAGDRGEFGLDGSVRIDGASYVDSGVTARNLQLDTQVHADPSQLRIHGIHVLFPQGGGVRGDLTLDHWLPHVPGQATLEPGPAKATVTPQKRLWNRHKTPAPAIALPAPAPSRWTLVKDPTQVVTVNGKVSANFENVALDTVLDIVGQEPFKRLGLDARLNGPATAAWNNGDVNTLAVTAQLNMSPSAQAVASEAPTSGAIDATYTQRDGSVAVRNVDVHLPGSSIQAHGTLGAYPMTSTTDLDIDFQSHNLGEFDTVLRGMGLHRGNTSGVAALPVALSGQASFHGNWAGSLLSPRLAGDLRATQLAVELPPGTSNAGSASGWIRWDTVEVSGSYTAERIAVVHSRLQQGASQIVVEGTLSLPGEVVTARTPERTGRMPRGDERPGFDATSLLYAHVRASQVDADQLLPLIGLNAPVHGMVDARLDTEGPLQSLSANGWVELYRAALYGEPVDSVRAQGSLKNRVLKLSSVTLTAKAGTISGSGTYDLRSRRFDAETHGSSIEVDKIERVSGSGQGVAGILDFRIAASGTPDNPQVEGHATLARFELGSEPLGALALVAHTTGRDVIYRVTSHLQAAEFQAEAKTALYGDYATQGQISFSQFNVGALLKMAHVEGISGESALAGVANFHGPLAHPEQMQGDAHLQGMAVTVAGVHLNSDGAVHAGLDNARVTLDPIHVVGDQTDLHAQGTLSLKDKRQLDFAASGSVNLKLAQMLDPDLTAGGTTTFQVEAHGPLANPGLRGKIVFENGSLSLEDVPNGLSQLHGTLEFNQNRLEVRSLTAMSGGGQLSVLGYLTYQHGLFADLTVTGKSVRIRYPQGVSSLADATLHLQGTQPNLLLSGNVLLTRFSISPEFDVATLTAQTSAVQTVVAPDAPSNHIRLDVRVQSSPQLNFQNAYAKLAGDVDLRLRGTLASPSLLGRISITEGNATIAGTRYELQRGDIQFTNPVRIQPTIDLNATARVEDYDITLGLHGTPEKLSITYRSDPPLPEGDVVALLALGRSQSEQGIYTQQQEQSAGVNPSTDVLLGGALNATVSSRVQKLFGAGAVKVDPSYIGALGNSTTRITVDEQLGKNVTLTYATNVDTSAQQLLQAEVAINRHVSLLVTRDESGVFSMVLKAVRRYR